MIKPYGSETLDPPTFSLRSPDDYINTDGMTSIPISSLAASMLVMMGSGYFNPIQRFMDIDEAHMVAEKMRTRDGLMWPVPIVCPVSFETVQNKNISPGSRYVLTCGNSAIAFLDLEKVCEWNSFDSILQGTFGTTDPEHPGVKKMSSQGNWFLSGPVTVLNNWYFRDEFPETFRTALEIREEIFVRGWQKTVAFQTRNPMHRAHEELCRMALEETGADGLLNDMLLGKLKKGDIPADIRDRAIRAMVDKRFAPGQVSISGYGFDMLYAGPREAILHAIMRQNAGCTHLIVGRDHAGVGNYYGPFEAQEVLDKVADHLEIEVWKGDHTCWSKKLEKVVRMGDHPDHTKEDWLFLSGTKVREMLSAGEDLPEEFSRPEVATILKEHYRGETV